MAGSASRGVEYALALVWGEAALQRAEAEGAGPDTRYCTILYCTALYCTVLYCTVLCCTVLSLLGLTDTGPFLIF